MLTGGPSDPAHCFGRELGVGSDLWHYTDELRAGRMTREDYDLIETALIPTHGHCNEMGTASTMSVLVEAMGLALSGSSLVPATDPRRRRAVERTGERAVALALEQLRPRDLLDRRSLHNALVTLMAVGGSTNAVVHLAAFAGRLGLDLPLRRQRDPARSGLEPTAPAGVRHVPPSARALLPGEGCARARRCVRKMTAEPASRLGLADRGVVRAGAVADLVVFDPATVIDNADFSAPPAAPTGIDTVIVAGTVMVDAGMISADRPGVVLRRA